MDSVVRGFNLLEDFSDSLLNKENYTDTFVYTYLIFKKVTFSKCFVFSAFSVD